VVPRKKETLGVGDSEGPTVKDSEGPGKESGKPAGREEEEWGGEAEQQSQEGVERRPRMRELINSS
jgi:hypothetical protein